MGGQRRLLQVSGVADGLGVAALDAGGWLAAWTEGETMEWKTSAGLKEARS